MSQRGRGGFVASLCRDHLGGAAREKSSACCPSRGWLCLQLSGFFKNEAFLRKKSVLPTVLCEAPCGFPLPFQQSQGPSRPASMM